MARFVLWHRHAPTECRAAFASWKGFDSPLRGGRALASCVTGGHAVLLLADAEDGDAARAQLPPYVARRTEVVEVSEAEIP